MNESNFKIIDVIRGTTVDGPGFRTAIYMAGCNHHCPGCHNPHTWDPGNGTDISLSRLLEIIKEEDFNVTLTGGDPLFFPEKAILLAREIHNLGYTVWLYTGFTYEEILRSPVLNKILPYLEAVVDGPFVEELKDPDLPFRGSSNQRIVFINKDSSIVR